MTVIGFVLVSIFLCPLGFASSIHLESRVCGAVHFGFLNLEDQKGLYINGDLVNSDLFCETLQVHVANNCSFENFGGFHHCLPNAGPGMYHSSNLLQIETKEQTIIVAEDSSGPKVTLAAGGFLCLCCIAMCPCFYKRSRAQSEVALDKEISINSISSAEAGSAHDKIPASPMRVPPTPPRFATSPKLNRLQSVNLTMAQVAKATRNFSPKLLIGVGNFGSVYKATLDDGQVVVIKRAKKEYVEHLSSEFSSEVDLLAKIDHKNLVKLLGYIEKGKERVIITEFVSNGTLREHLDGQHGKILDFNQRLEISIDIAHGLTYLHLYAEKQIIHRDVTSSNILITSTMRAKVTDFGLARVGIVDSDQTHVSTNVKGTVGYLDPEYMRTYKLNAKSDVYSFGILLLEILTGRRPVDKKRPVDERVNLRWAFGKFREGLVRTLVDPMMEEIVPMNILDKMFYLAFECAAPNRSIRPDMKTVGEKLWRIRKDYSNTSHTSRTA